MPTTPCNIGPAAQVPDAAHMQNKTWSSLTTTAPALCPQFQELIQGSQATGTAVPCKPLSPFAPFARPSAGHLHRSMRPGNSCRSPHHMFKPLSRPCRSQVRELRSQAAGDISVLRIAQERLRAVEGSLADAQRRGQAQAATIETQGLQMEQLRVALQVSAASGSACLPGVLSSNGQGLQVKQLRVAVQMANAACCICTPRLPSLETQGLQMGQLRVAAQSGRCFVLCSRHAGSCCIPCPHPPSHAERAISAPQCTKTFLCLIELEAPVSAQMVSEATGPCLLQAAQAQVRSAGAFQHAAAGRWHARQTSYVHCKPRPADTCLQALVR